MEIAQYKGGFPSPTGPEAGYPVNPASERTSRMKEIMCLLRSSKWNATARELREAGFFAMTRHRASGRGKQKGLRGGEGEGGVRLLPKWQLIMVVEDRQVQPAVEALIRANRTGSIGDGKIFITKVTETVRVSTEEFGYPALC